VPDQLQAEDSNDTAAAGILIHKTSQLATIKCMRVNKICERYERTASRLSCDLCRLQADNKWRWFLRIHERTV